MNIALCTLCEGHYHHGVAALVNSLVAGGYEGTVWVGHRGPLPAWMTNRSAFDRIQGRLVVTPAVAIQTVRLDPPISLNYYKPNFIREIFETHAPETDAVAYLDPDMVMKCKWAEIECWFVADGIALVEDVPASLAGFHAKRLRWQSFFEAHGETQSRTLERYYNSGFVAVPRARLDDVRAWQRICECVVAEIGTVPRQRKAGGPEHLFHSTDEDALNFALTLSGTRLETQGPEAMDFAPGGRHLSHAVGAVKPWQGRHFRRALCGLPPSVASAWYYHFAGGPLRPFSAMKLARRRLSMRLAKAVGRLYRRA